MFPSSAIAMNQWKSKIQNNHQKLNEKVASRIVERFETEDLRE